MFRDLSLDVANTSAAAIDRRNAEIQRQVVVTVALTVFQGLLTFALAFAIIRQYRHRRVAQHDAEAAKLKLVETAARLEKQSMTKVNATDNFSAPEPEEMCGLPDPIKGHGGRHSIRGFSLVECVIALLILMITSLAVAAVFNFSFRSSADAKKRFGAMLLAQQRIEDLRNTDFSNLTAGTVNENNVVLEAVTYNIVRTITDNDLIATTAAPGPETKKITVTVTAVNNPIVSDNVTLTTYRMVNRPGPNRSPNP